MNRIGMDIVQAWTYEQACRLMDETLFDVAYLDHDLSDLAAAGAAPEEEKTGTHVAEYIAAMDPAKRPQYVIIHSYNDYGRLRMQRILRDAGVSCRIELFNG